MEGPILKLVINKGPREGETIESDAASKIRIGRVIKGNTFAIRDNGISQKHLLIEFDGANWTLCDLDSSNGTFLNENQIAAMKAFNLSDGDTIKIGVKTSILVKIELRDGNSDPKVVGVQPRRNPSRGTKLKRGKLKKDQEQVSEQKTSNSVASYCDKQVHEAPELDPLLDAPANRGRGLRRRGATKKTETTEDKVLVHQVENRPHSKRKRKVEGHAESSNLLSDSHRAEVAREANIMLEAPANDARVTRRWLAATKAAEKRDVTVACEVNEKEQMAVEPEAEGTVHRAEERMTQADAMLEAPANNGRVTRQCRAVTKAAAKRDAILACDVKGKERMTVGPEAESSAHLNDRGIPDYNDTAAGELENISTSFSNAIGGKECQGSGGETSDRIDLEKMTLGEWFDRMEKYLPTRINEIADDIIAKLRERQKQFGEYVSKHHKENQ